MNFPRLSAYFTCFILFIFIKLAKQKVINNNNTVHVRAYVNDSG